MNNKPKPDLYLSVDIESTGDLPPVNSMISLAAVPFYRPDAARPNGQIIEPHFQVNIEQLFGSVMDKETEEFWRLWPSAWETATKDPVNPFIAMGMFSDYLHFLTQQENNKHLVFVGWPATFDFDFVKYYLKVYHQGINPFGVAAFDLKTLAYVVLGSRRFRDIRSRKLPADLLADVIHDHTAYADALGQAHLAINLFKALDRLYEDAATTQGFRMLLKPY